MSGPKFEINGGNVQIGNVVQGDGNAVSVSNQTQTNAVDRAFADAFTALDARCAASPADAQEVALLREELTSLKRDVEAKRPGKLGTLNATAKALTETYAWAGPLLEKLFAMLPIM